MWTHYAVLLKSWFCRDLRCLSRNLFWRDLRTFVWRKMKPKIAYVEKKWQIWGMHLPLNLDLHLLVALNSFRPTVSTLWCEWEDDDGWQKTTKFFIGGDDDMFLWKSFTLHCPGGARGQRKIALDWKLSLPLAILSGWAISMHWRWRANRCWWLIWWAPPKNYGQGHDLHIYHENAWHWLSQMPSYSLSSWRWWSGVYEENPSKCGWILPGHLSDS